MGKTYKMLFANPRPGRGNMSKILAKPAVVVVLLIVFLLIGLGAGYAVWGVAPPAPYEERRIVALLPLTGVLSTYGENSKFAALLAEKDVNLWLESLGKDWRLKVIIEDTGTDPATARSKLEHWHGAGVKFFAGPMSSGEVSECKSYADANHLIVVSPSSTSPALREDDWVFRFCPHDFVQGPALAKLIWDCGVTDLIISWRGDTWGDGLASAVKEAFEDLGGTVHYYEEQTFRYDPAKTDFPDVASLLNDKVNELIGKGIPKENIGIDVIAFEEISPYMEDCAAYDVLKEVKWFGSDGTCLQPALVEHDVAGPFAAEVKFVNTIFAPGLSNHPRFEYVRGMGLQVLGRELDAYAYATYDIIWCLAVAIDKYGYDPDVVRPHLKSITDDWTEDYGASGHIVLDENGDRAYADYDLYAVVFEDGTPTWKKVGVWHGPPPGEIEWIEEGWPPSS